MSAQTKGKTATASSNGLVILVAFVGFLQLTFRPKPYSGSPEIPEPKPLIAKTWFGNKDHLQVYTPGRKRNSRCGKGSCFLLLLSPRVNIRAMIVINAILLNRRRLYRKENEDATLPYRKPMRYLGWNLYDITRLDGEP